MPRYAKTILWLVSPVLVLILSFVFYLLNNLFVDSANTTVTSIYASGPLGAIAYTLFIVAIVLIPLGILMVLRTGKK